MNILCIGNSFTEDATHYLHQLAKAVHVDIQITNLVIGGCSLETHFKNLVSDASLYGLHYNGYPTGIKVSLKEALMSKNFDVITLQQVSHHAYIYETYYPYIQKLVSFIRDVCPKSKIYFQYTWAYEEGSARLCEECKFEHSDDMFHAIVNNMDRILEEQHLDGKIPTAYAMQILSKMGIGPVHRDTFHAQFGYGRLCQAYTWFETLTGLSCIGNPFRDLDLETTEEQIEAAQKAAHQAILEALS